MISLGLRIALAKIGGAVTPLLPPAEILRTLYGAGEQGIAVPDLTPGNGYMFQDSAGTIPVTAYEQPVGLILDRSKGLVLGPELVTNGDFSNGTTGWSAFNASSAISNVGGKLLIQNNGGGVDAGAKTVFTSTSGKTYKLVYTVEAVTINKSIVAYTSPGTAASGTLDRTVTPSNTSAIQYTAYVLANTTSITINIRFAGGSDTSGNSFYISGVSAKELPGNHIIQATSTKRPTLSARYNLLTRTDEFDNSAWAKNNAIITANSVESPTGTNTAERFSGISGNSTYFNQSGAVSIGVGYSFAIYAKSDSTNILQILGGNAGFAASFANFDLSDGSIGTVSGCTAQISFAGNGWWRCQVAQTATGNDTSNFFIALVPSKTSARVAPLTANASVFVWGADLRRTIDTIGQPAYQRVGAPTDYDTAGFYPYLVFDGTDDSMATAASVDFTGTDKMTVFAGVTKLSDAALAVVTELSATIASNNGAFLLSAPNSAAANYNFSSKGTTQADNTVTTYTAPNAAVISASGDISAPSNVIRVNGAQVGSVFTSQGTGNYANATLFFGGRNNASAFLNGRLYPFFIRGAATDATTSAQVEQYIRVRMPVSF